MSSEKDIVVTVYGHDKVIDKIAISSFETEADTYCNSINKLEFDEKAWISAKIIKEGEQYPFNAFLPERFDIILDMDDRSVQKLLREVDCMGLAKALKGGSEEVKAKIFKNMSVRAVQMLKEDMDYIGPVLKEDVKECQKKILAIIRYLSDSGEIFIVPQGEVIV